MRVLRQPLHRRAEEQIAQLSLSCGRRNEDEGAKQKNNEWRARKVDTDDREKCEENFSKRPVTRFFARSNLFVPAGSPHHFLLETLCLSCSLWYSKNFILSFTKIVFMAFRNPMQNIILKIQGRERCKHEQI